MEKSYICEPYSKTFSRKVILKERCRVPSKEKLYICETCFKSFSRQSDLNMHSFVHTKEKLFVCDECCVSFSVQSALRNSAHTRPYICEPCRKTLPRKFALNERYAFQTREKPYVCETCLKNFSRKSSLNVYSRVNSEEKLSVCDECCMSFAIQASARNQSTYTMEKPNICEPYSKALPKKLILKERHPIHSKKTCMCEICLKRFSRKGSLNTYSRVHF